MSATAYPILELRRHAVAAGSTAHVARYLDTWCLEDEQAHGSIAFGQFVERGRDDRVAWLRGYRDLQARTAMHQEPVRRAREQVLQRYMLGSHSLLLRPLHPGAQIPQLAPVDPRTEPDGAQGLALAQLLPAASGRLAECAQAADAWFARYSGRGMIEAGILASLDEHDAGGGWLVWLGILRDEAALQALRPQCEGCAAALQKDGLLRAPHELLVLAPAPRSRLRWAPRTIG